MTGDTLNDVLAPGLIAVFCGTQASKVSAAKRAYYAKPGNRFWPTLHAVGLTPRRFIPDDFTDLLSLGIGLTDLAKKTSGQDAAIETAHVDLERFRRSMMQNAPKLIAFTSKTAARHALRARDTATLSYGRHSQTFEGMEVHILPSTSGLATSHWTIEPWHQLATRIRDLKNHAPA